MSKVLKTVGQIAGAAATVAILASGPIGAAIGLSGAAAGAPSSGFIAGRKR